MALAARAPDIILRPSIPLAATSDQPLADVARPPESASNDASDQAGGTPKEITPQALAEAANARKGDPGTANDDADDTQDAAADETDGKLTVANADIEDGAVDPKLPSWAKRQVLEEKRKSREYRAALEAAAKAKVGDPAWEAAINLARDQAIQKEREATSGAKKQAREAEAAAEAAKQELEALKAKTPVTPPEEPKADPRPSRDAFDDPDAYDDALTAWAGREGERRAEQKVADETAAREVEAKRVADAKALEAHEAAVVAIHTEWQEKRSAAVEKYPDYADIAEADPKDGGPLVSEAMAAAIMKIPNGTDVAYYLGQNTDEAARINALTDPIMHFIEIGKVAERLANPPRRRAPRQEPIEPIDTSSAPADTSEQELDMNAYADKRMKEIQQAKRPFFPPGGLH